MNDRVPRFTVETSSGSVLASFEEAGDYPLPARDMAIQEAKTRLEDDPEMGSLDVVSFGSDDYGYCIGEACHAPDADWQPVVVFRATGEKITPPGPIPSAGMSDADFEAYISDAYADNWAKREGMRQMREQGYA